MRFGLALVLAAVLTFSGFAQQQEDWFQGVPIRNIVFEGLIHLSASDLDGIIAPFIGATFTDNTYWELLGRLYALEYFESITPTAVMADAAGSEVILRFTVVERPTVMSINFIGNANIRRTELLGVITLSVNDVATQVRMRMDELAIINRYLERGYPDVSVRSETIDAGNSRVVLNFHIDEGERIAIERFIFEGNTTFSHRVLQRQLSLRTRGIFADGAFNEAMLIADRQALVQYYHDRGFIDAQIIDDAREIRRDDRGNNLMTITFRIYEGRMHTFGGINFEGNRIFSDSQLQAQMQSRVGEPVNARRLQADLIRIQSLYFENGYIFNHIEPVFHQDRDAGIFSVNMFIVERSRAHIENIIVRGNERTRDHVILREIPLVPGDVFSQTQIIEGMRNLFNLQFFSAINPETPPGSVDSLMDLIINVEEQPTTDVQFGVTFSGSAEPNTFPMSLMARWTDRNFLGTGNMLGADIVAAFDTQTFSTQYTHRWLFGLPLSASFDFTVQHLRRRAALANFNHFFHGDEARSFPAPFDSWEQFEAANRIPPSEYLMPYNQWRMSVGVGSGYRWSTPFGNLGLGGGFRVGMTFNNYDSFRYTPFDPLLRERNNQWTPATSIWTNISLDQRDIFFDPTRGYYIAQRIGFFGILPVEQEHFIRTDTRAQWFHTLFDIAVTDNWNFRAVFGVHTGLSFIFPQPGQRGESGPSIAEANRLAVDGMFVGRGWTGEFSRKGLALWENWAEIRIPLAPGIIAWDFFFDAAGIKPTPGDLFTNFMGNDGSLGGSDTFFMRFSMGGGFRFTIPQFPLRFSLAQRFLIRDGQVEWQSGAIGPAHGRWGLDFVISFALAMF